MRTQERKRRGESLLAIVDGDRDRVNGGGRGGGVADEVLSWERELERERSQIVGLLERWQGAVLAKYLVVIGCGG